MKYLFKNGKKEYKEYKGFMPLEEKLKIDKRSIALNKKMKKIFYFPEL